jgi:multiple sugar transport system ATP-binding protein
MDDCRLEEIMNSEIYFGNRFVSDVQPKDRDVAVVFQNYALHPHISDRKIFHLGLS